MFKILLFITFCYSVNAANFTCAASGNTCQLNVANLSEGDTIVPQHSNPSQVVHLILRGNVPVLVGGFCDVFPNLSQLDASSVAMREIRETAFQGCKNMIRIVMEFNKYEKVAGNAFKGMPNLEYLSIFGGETSLKDLDLRDTQKIYLLLLSNLGLVDLPAEVLRGQQSLKDLYVYSNYLFDLDVEKILPNTPNLKNIYLADNNFNCSRLKEILSFLNQNNVQVSSFSYNVRERNYTVNSVDGIQCLPDSIYASEWERLHPEPERDELKEALEEILEKLDELSESQKVQDERIKALESALEEQNQNHTESVSKLEKNFLKLCGTSNFNLVF